MSSLFALQPAPPFSEVTSKIFSNVVLFFSSFWLHAGQHHGERHNLIARLQDLACLKSVRISFVGGDVHVAGVGRLYTQPKAHRLRHDHRFMPQVSPLVHRLRHEHRFMPQVSPFD